MRKEGPLGPAFKLEDPNFTSGKGHNTLAWYVSGKSLIRNAVG